jgi:hypothetical protein
MMRECQTYSRKVAPSKTIINCSNHGFMLKTCRVVTLSSRKYTISNYACKFRCYSYIGTKFIRSPCYISKLALSPPKFTHPPPCCNWIRTFRQYGVMMPFSGITLRQNIMKIGELLHDLWWMDKRQYSPPWYPCLKNSPSYVEIELIYSRKLLYKYGNIYCSTADLLVEPLIFCPVMGLAVLELRSKYSLSEHKPA